MYCVMTCKLSPDLKRLRKQALTALPAMQIVVLTWGESQRDIEMVVQILEQASRAP